MSNEFARFDFEDYFKALTTMPIVTISIVVIAILTEMQLPFLRNKKIPKISRHLTAVDGQVIARTGEWLDQSLRERLRKWLPEGSMRFEKLENTYHFFNLRVLLKDKKYRVVKSLAERKDWLLKVLSTIQINSLIDQELTWFERYRYHYDHALAVAALTALMASQQQKKEDQVREAAFCALTHDFGITRIPEAILTKVSSLREDESKILQEHPIYSYCLLTYYGLNAPFQNATVGLGHHEYLLGCGYPRGIAQDHELCQMVQICDIFDALISSRPFRPAKTTEQAIAILANMTEKGRLNTDFLNILKSLLKTEIHA